MIFRIGLLLFFFWQTVCAQQNEDFRNVKSHFDRQKLLLTNEFNKKNNELDANGKIQLQKQFLEFMAKLDSVQNASLVRALVKVKNDEDLKKITNPKSSEAGMQQPSAANADHTPEYPGGINNLRTQVVDLFYFDSSADEKILKADITFVVEKEGNISNVMASGKDINFNRQAIIAVYLLPEKFRPATINGAPVTYTFRLPLTMNFE